MDHLAKSPESSWETPNREGKAIQNLSVLFLAALSTVLRSVCTLSVGVLMAGNGPTVKRPKGHCSVLGATSCLALFTCAVARRKLAYSAGLCTLKIGWQDISSPIDCVATLTIGWLNPPAHPLQITGVEFWA
jgi:hypothetical protein